MGTLSTARNTVVTLGRKLQKSLLQRGIAGTVWRAIKWPWTVVKSLAQSADSRRRAILKEEASYDVRFHIDTCSESDSGWMAEIESPNWMHGTGYDPVSIRGFQSVMAQLEFEPVGFAFVDLGCGKGRTLLLASHWPFHEIIGVEYSRRLYEVAIRNIGNYSHPDRRCKSVRVECIDAQLFRIPDLPCILFLHNPFGIPVLRPVLERLELSLQAKPRRVIVVYFDATHHEVVDECRSLFRVAEGIVPDSKNEKYIVWDTETE